MENIYLTGYSIKKFGQIVKKNEKPGCYLCKRKPGDKGIFFITDDGEEDIGDCRLNLEFFEVVTAGKKFQYPVCHECGIMLTSLAEKSDFSKRLFDKPSLN